MLSNLPNKIFNLEGAWYMQWKSLLDHNKLLKTLIFLTTALFILLLLNTGGNIVNSIFNCGYELGSSLGNVLFK